MIYITVTLYEDEIRASKFLNSVRKHTSSRVKIGEITRDSKSYTVKVWMDETDPSLARSVLRKAGIRYYKHFII